jgi:hypothetical protein
MNPPPKTQCPNFKIDKLIQWLRYIWKEAWELEKAFSVDKQLCQMCTMDSLFNSVKLSCAIFCFKKPVLVPKVLWKSGQGCPLCVF